MHINFFKIVSSIMSIILVFSMPSYAMKMNCSSKVSGQKAQLVITTARYRNKQQEQLNMQSNSSYPNSRNILQRHGKKPVGGKSNVIIKREPIAQEVSQLSQSEALIDCAKLTDIGLAFQQDAQKNLDHQKMIEESLIAFEVEQKIIESAQRAAKEYQAREEKKRANIATLKAQGYIFPECK